MERHKKIKQFSIKTDKLYKLHFGPGEGWIKPDNSWLTIDIDPKRADILINFNKFKSLPLNDNSVSVIYASHIFEHINIFAAPKVFRECFRVLIPGGFLRIIIPDVRKSIEEYVKGNYEYPLFQRRMNFIKKRFNYGEVALFEALKGDFISATGQPDLLGTNTLAHQNAWDFDALKLDLIRVGFTKENIFKVDFQVTNCPDFLFEGIYKSEADEVYRSLYVEVIK